MIKRALSGIKVPISLDLIQAYGCLGEGSLELRLLRSVAREIGTKGFDTRRLRGINRKDNIVTGRNAIVR